MAAQFTLETGSVPGAITEDDSRGGAQVSAMHTNFLINTGTATSADIEGLGDEVRRRVKEKSGVELEWEIQRVGIFAAAPEIQRVDNT